jgi:hypothetical protein
MSIHSQLTVNRTDVTQCIIDDSECRIEESNVKNYQKITTRSDNIVIIVGSFPSSFAALSNIYNISFDLLGFVTVIKPSVCFAAALVAFSPTAAMYNGIFPEEGGV